MSSGHNSGNPDVLESGSDDFIARCRGEITASEYVRRLQERIARRRARNSEPYTTPSGRVVWLPKRRSR